MVNLTLDHADVLGPEHMKSILGIFFIDFKFTYRNYSCVFLGRDCEEYNLCVYICT